jgi:hypothetical protein
MSRKPYNTRPRPMTELPDCEFKQFCSDFPSTITFLEYVESTDPDNPTNVPFLIVGCLDGSLWIVDEDGDKTLIQPPAPVN